MLQYEGAAGPASGKPSRARHLRSEHLQIKTPTVAGEPRDVAADGRVRAEIGAHSKAIERVVVPVQLHAHAAHQGIALEPVELKAHVVRGKIRIGDDRVRPAGLFGGALHPGGLTIEPLGRPIGLHIDRFYDAIAGEVIEIFADRIIAPDRFVRTKYARLHRPDQPGQISLPPDMMMRVDDAGHAALLCRSESTCGTTAAFDPPSALSSTKRWMAISADRER